MAVKADGTLVTWAIKSSQSRTIIGLSNVVAVAAGREGLALTRDGRVFEIEPHSDLDQNSDKARQIIGLSNAVAIAAGNSRSLALRRDGSIAVVWGDNYPYFPSEPVHLTSVIGIAVGDNFCLALQNEAP